jgi:membrane fusion protein, copper/silver efflux system
MSAASNRTILISAAAVAALAVVGIAGFWLGSRQAPQIARSDDRPVLYWYDPMVPDQHFDKPGKSPFMDMQLVPRYAGDPEPVPGVSIDPGVIQNLGVRFAVVEKADVQNSITVSGVITFNDRDVAVVQAKQGGFVERSYRRALGDIVRAGDPIVDLRAPEWTGGLAEYLALRKGGDTALSDAARRRLAMLGIPADAVRDAEASGEPPSVFTIRAPIAGAVTSLDVRAGMAVEPGAAIASINGLSPIWLVASVPQGVAGQLKAGGRVTATIPAYPGEMLAGKIEAVLPSASVASRAVEVRVALPNPTGRLRPGMTGEVDLSEAEARQALVVPSEAVIRTGRRTIVIAVLEDGRFAPTKIEAGASTGGRTVVVSGLNEGQRIVSSGQFLIDSEASLSGVIARLESSQSVGLVEPYAASGRVAAIDDKGVTIAHTPVDRLSWPAMTMSFAWGASGPQVIAVGDEVAFTFKKGSTGYVIETIRREGQR